MKISARAMPQTSCHKRDVPDTLLDEGTTRETKQCLPTTGKVSLRSGVPRAIPTVVCCAHITMKWCHTYSQNCPGLDNKLNAHTTHRVTFYRRDQEASLHGNFVEIGQKDRIQVHSWSSRHPPRAGVSSPQAINWYWSLAC